MNNYLKHISLFKSEIIACIFAIVFYALWLLCSDKFVYKSQFFYYFFALTICILLFYVALQLCLNKNKPTNIPINILSIISVLFLFFPLMFKFLTENVEWYFSISFICVFALVLLLSFSFSNNYIRKNTVEKTIILFAVAECIICVLQFFSVFRQSTFFSVTGSNANPNVTAMFLTLAFPLIVRQFTNSVKTKKIAIILIIVLVLSAMIVLKSRTAFIGLSVVVFVLSIYYLKNRFRKLLIPFIAVGMLAAFFVSVKLYNFKENSADGRLFVWKVATEMVSKQPLGYGYGMIQGEYNKAQAMYFANNQTTETEKRNATYMHNLMNDYLEMFIQGGIVGGVLYLLFILLLIYYGFKRLKRNLFYVSGILAFAAMSLFNFAFYMPFVVTVFVYYVAQIISSSQSPILVKVQKQSLFSILLIVIGLSVSSYFVLQIRSQFNLTKINESLKEKNLTKSKILMDRTFHFLGTSELYYRSIGDIYLLDKDYIAAKNHYEQAIKHSPFPEIIMRKAYCEMRLKNYEQTEHDLLFASNIQPALFQPHYNLMMLYLNTKDLQRAKEKAGHILQKDIKIPSERIDSYKEQANEILEALN